MENNIDIATPDTTATINQDNGVSPYSDEAKKD